MQTDDLPEFMRRRVHYTRHDKLMAFNAVGAGTMLAFAGLWTLGRLIAGDICRTMIGASAACFVFGFAGTLTALSF
jgi:hypothetical protein